MKYSYYNTIWFLFVIIIIAVSIRIYLDVDEAFSSGNTIKILHLVLYSTDNGGPYDKMKRITSKYYNSYPNIKTIYYRFSQELPDGVQYELLGNELLIRGDETYIPGILQKTISTFEYFNDELDQYDYVVRSNISTIIRFDLLSKDLEKNSVDYGCALCWYSDSPYSSGTSIILSPRMVNNIIDNKTVIDYDVIDDVSIGKFISTYNNDISMKPVMKSLDNNGFYFTPNMNSDKTRLTEYIAQNEIVFYRNHNGDRELDANQMEIIVDNIMEI